MNVDHPIVTEQYQNLFVARNYAGTKLDRAYRGLYEYPWKLVSYSDGSLELYNLQEDPTEQYDQSADRIVLAREMQIRLEQHMASVVPIVRPDETTPILDKDVLEGLKALGYHQ
jgi:hypothetical protein